ncbi:GIY-YIG nuclease family protein [Micromonospora sp. RTP1Z1]|uniref:GIY-YIG nuclease family protein n=1 Tax=Micromonospora sp. RTP1Z1 TaxID=2994043 RepID=UPI0029C94344|nr:GIY-YIG nuclease family protein [Micromonospora sp. RTP1Z1]
MTSPTALLAGFSDPQPFTPDTAAAAPAAAGVHVLLDGDVVLYVGSTGNLRRRLRQHLTGNRGSSVLHDQVGQLLDSSEPAASAAEIAEWLGRCTVSWCETDNPEGTKDALVLALVPCFNRRIPQPRR